MFHHPCLPGVLLGSCWRYLGIAEDAAVVHWNLPDFHPGTVINKRSYMTQTHSKLDWWGGWLPLLPVVVEHNHKPGTFPCEVASSLSSLFPKWSLLRRAGHLLCSYSIHCPSVLPYDEQGCSLLHQNIGLVFRTLIWAKHNRKPSFPSTVPGPCWNAICVGGQYLKQIAPSEYFQSGLDVFLERQEWVVQGFPTFALELLYTCNNQVRKCGLIKHAGFHMPTMWRDSVSVISMMLWSLHVLSSCHYRHKLFAPVSLRLQQPLNFHLGRPVCCFPLLFHLQSCLWEGWVSDGEEVGSNGSDRNMFILEFCVVSLSNGGWTIYPAQ